MKNPSVDSTHSITGHSDERLGETERPLTCRASTSLIQSKSASSPPQSWTCASPSDCASHDRQCTSGARTEWKWWLELGFRVIVSSFLILSLSSSYSSTEIEWEFRYHGQNNKMMILQAYPDRIRWSKAYNRRRRQTGWGDKATLQFIIIIDSQQYWHFIGISDGSGEASGLPLDRCINAISNEIVICAFNFIRDRIDVIRVWLWQEWSMIRTISQRKFKTIISHQRDPDGSFQSACRTSRSAARPPVSPSIPSAVACSHRAADSADRSTYSACARANWREMSECPSRDHRRRSSCPLPEWTYNKMSLVILSSSKSSRKIGYAKVSGDKSY